MQNHFHIAVSQLAKKPLPTLQAFATKDLAVGRKPKTALHTPTHTGGNPPMAPKRITDFIALVQFLYPQFTVSFTASPYLVTHFNDCRKEQLNLFLDLVKTFTLLHYSNRKSPIENVLVTADEDYSEAFKCWQQCQPSQPQPVYMPTLQRILQLLHYRYENQPFTAQKIAAQLNYSTDYMSKVLEHLLQQKKIEVIENNPKMNKRFFKLCA